MSTLDEGEPDPSMRVPLHMIERNKFEDEYPMMYKFYFERGRLNDFQLQKVQEIQLRWKAGLVFWLTHDNQEIEIPEWVAVNVVINNKQNVGRGSRICMSLNHTKGYGCNRLAEGMCTYVHECALCAQEDHGVFQKKGNGTWVCNKLRRWYEEELRYKSQGFGDPRKHEEALTELARRPRPPTRPAAPRPAGEPQGGSVWGPPPSGLAPQPVGGESTGAASSPTSSQRQEQDQQQRQRSNTQGRFHQDEMQESQRQMQDLSSETSTSQHGGDAGLGDTGEGPRLPPSQPPPPRLPSNWQALWCEEQQAYYYWQTGSQQTTWELPAMDEGTAEPAQKEDAPATAAANGNSSYSRAPRAGQQNQKPQQKPGDGDNPQPARDIKQGNYVCSQHWYPQTADCIRVFQGERVVVTWADDAQGWAYGHTVDDPGKLGYFPQAVLKEPRRAPRRREAGEVCSVAEIFIAPEMVGGYLSVAPGDDLRVLFPLEAQCAWAYMQREGSSGTNGNSPGAQQEVGWVPEAFLCDHPEAHRDWGSQPVA